MKFLLILLFVFSCSVKEKKRQNPLTMNKRVPAQNRTIINQLNSKSIEETLKRIKMLEGSQEESYSAVKYERSAPTREPMHNSRGSEVSSLKQNQFANQNVAKNQFDINNTPQNQPSNQYQNYQTQQSKNFANANPQNKVTPPIKEVASKKENDILEISGMQNKSQTKKASAEHKFIFSTSSSYIGESMDNARNTLSEFGIVKPVKIGDMFALKVYPKEPILSKVEADIFLKNIIKKPFFDIYIEDINP